MKSDGRRPKEEWRWRDTEEMVSRRWVGQMIQRWMKAMITMSMDDNLSPGVLGSQTGTPLTRTEMGMVMNDDIFCYSQKSDLGS